MAELTVNLVDRLPPDARLEQIASRGDGSIRLRLQPLLYDPSKQQYSAWSQVTWSLRVEDTAEAKRLREALNGLFKVFAAGEAYQAVVLDGLRELSAGLS
jgi:hypothetical protein